VAVTVEDLPSVLLDETDRIVGANAAAGHWVADHLGELVFDSFPGIETLLRPHLERARRQGRSLEFAAFYKGAVGHVTLTPSGTMVAVTWEVLEVLDTQTLDGLRSSLESAIAKLDAAGHALERNRVRDSLRVVVGGA